MENILKWWILSYLGDWWYRVIPLLLSEFLPSLLRSNLKNCMHWPAPTQRSKDVGVIIISGEEKKNFPLQGIHSIKLCGGVISPQSWLWKMFRTKRLGNMNKLGESRLLYQNRVSRTNEIQLVLPPVLINLISIILISDSRWHRSLSCVPFCWFIPLQDFL